MAAPVTYMVVAKYMMSTLILLLDLAVMTLKKCFSK